MSRWSSSCRHEWRRVGFSACCRAPWGIGAIEAARGQASRLDWRTTDGSLKAQRWWGPPIGDPCGRLAGTSPNPRLSPRRRETAAPACSGSTGSIGVVRVAWLAPRGGGVSAVQPATSTAWRNPRRPSVCCSAGQDGAGWSSSSAAGGGRSGWLRDELVELALPGGSGAPRADAAGVKELDEPDEVGGHIVLARRCGAIKVNSLQAASLGQVRRYPQGLRRRACLFVPFATCAVDGCRLSWRVASPRTGAAAPTRARLRCCRL